MSDLIRALTGGITIIGQVAPGTLGHGRGGLVTGGTRVCCGRLGLGQDTHVVVANDRGTGHTDGIFTSVDQEIVPFTCPCDWVDTAEIDKTKARGLGRAMTTGIHHVTGLGQDGLLGRVVIGRVWQEDLGLLPVGRASLGVMKDGHVGLADLNVGNGCHGGEERK